MINVKQCILCNSSNSKHIIKKNRWNIIQCKECNLIYVSPCPEPATLVDLYNSSAKYGKNEEIGQGSPGHERHKKRKFSIALNLIKSTKSNIESVFDYGCSTGAFLRMVKQEGWNAYGCDVNLNLVARRQKEFGRRVKVQVGDSIPYGDNSFDVVTIFDTLEHVVNPLTTLGELNRVLREDGVLVVSTPNIAGLFPRITYMCLCKTVKVWEHPTPPEHIYEFSKSTLLRVLNATGFRCLETKSFETYMPYTVGKLESSFAARLRKLKSKRQKVSEPCDDRKENETKAMSKARINQLLRMVFRASAYGFTYPLFMIANQLGAGNSLIVLAKKQRKSHIEKQAS